MIFMIQIWKQYSWYKYETNIRYSWYKYDIHLHGDETEDEISYKQLDYWVKSTKESIVKGKKLGDNFLLINHSVFCQQPKEQINRILSFVECNISEEVLRNLYKIPKVPSSLGRHKGFDLSIFDKDQINFVKELDFEV